LTAPRPARNLRGVDRGPCRRAGREENAMGESRSRPVTVDEAGGRRRQAGGVDLEVARRVRRRRVELGITQQRMAELIGVTLQQASRYETGASRLSVGRLHLVARALGVAVGYVFEDIDPTAAGGARAGSEGMPPQRRMMLELAQNFARIGSRREQEALCALARALATLPVPGQAT
jgi:transcriptional regulator with XRE-family HTH domain